MNDNELKEYACRLGIPFEEIMGRSRKAEVVMARQVWWWFLRDLSFGYSEIGRMFGRDHSTVIHGVNRVSDLIRLNDEYLNRYFDVLYF